MTLFRRLVRHDHGATAIEYALIAGAIALVIIAAVGTVGQSTKANFGNAANAFSTSSS